MRTTTQEISVLLCKRLKPEQLADILNAFLCVQDEEWATDRDVELTQTMMSEIMGYCPESGPIARGNVLCPGCNGNSNGTCQICNGFGEIDPLLAQQYGIFSEHATR